MGATSEAGQLELLPGGVPETQRASLNLADLSGWEHAHPSRELVESIGRLGLLQPVVVTGSPQARYAVVEGRRRAKAIAMLAAEGRWPSGTVQALIIKADGGYDDPVRAGMALALHASRSPSPASELRAIEAILQAGGEEAQTVKRIAEQTGMPVATVRRRLRVRDLSSAIRAAFDRGELAQAIAAALKCAESSS